MSDEPTVSPAAALLALFQSLRTTPPRLIQSPPTQPRRASVALIVRFRPAPDLAFAGHVPEGWTGQVIPESEYGLGLGLEDFFRLKWVNHPETIPELLFIRRSASPSPASSSAPPSSHSRWSSHVAFPGGRHEPADESALYTALRETWEEIGIDLAERDFVQVGRLDEREITTSLGKRLLMILSPFVFLQTSPFSPQPELQAAEVSSVHWIPLSALTPPFLPEQWSHIDIDISTRLSPRNRFIRWALRQLVGKMQFGCVLLPDEPDHMAEGFDNTVDFADPPDGGSGSWYDKAAGKRKLRLWGLSLGMTLDLLAHLPGTHPPPLLVAPSREGSRATSPDRVFGPRTPVTVTSSFDQQWEEARKTLEKEKKQAIPVKPLASISNGSSSAEKERMAVVGTLMKDPAADVGKTGAGLTSSGVLGTKVDVMRKGRKRRGVGPGVTAVFPRFSYPDVNFWIWVFGRRYRQIVKGWEASVRGPVRAADRRVNWSGAALSTFYSAVRQALVVAILLRALATAAGLGYIGWFLLRRFGYMAAGQVSGEL